MEKINYNEIISQQTVTDRLYALKREIERVKYVSISDALVNYNYGGSLAMQHLDAQEKEYTPGQRDHNTWKIRVLCNEWGDTPKDGDVVTIKRMKKLVDIAGRKLRSNIINDMKRRGVWEKEYIDKREYKIKDGCIVCGYTDAAHLLSEYGVHYDSLEPINGRRELSTEPCKAPDGSFKHVHYWRFVEVPPGTEITKGNR